MNEYFERQLRFLVKTGCSTRQIAKKLNVSQNKICRSLKRINLSTVHKQRYKKPKEKRFCCYCGLSLQKKSQKKFCSMNCSLLARWENKKENLLSSNNRNVSSNTLKKFLIEEMKIKNCCLCNQKPFWNGKRLVLQLDHIDGDSDNNNINNLRLLCPNCHTQTETFASKGKGSRYRKDTKRNSYLRRYKSNS